MHLLKRYLCLWGNAEHGRLGLGQTTGGKLWPQICKIGQDIKTVVCGGAHTVLLTGYDAGGPPERQLTPQPVKLPEAVKSIAAGHLHTLCLTGLSCLPFETDLSGPLGLGKRSMGQTTQPTQIDAFEGVEICCGASHSLGLSPSGEVYSWGSNQHGQLGHPKRLFSSACQTEPLLIRELRDIRVHSLAAGHVCSGAVDKDGVVYTWGGNQFWQLGYASNDHISPHPIQASLLAQHHSAKTMLSHALCIMANGRVFVWGTNENGCLGLGPKSLSSSPMPSPVESTQEPFLSDAMPQGDRLIETTITRPVLLKGTKLIQGSLGWKHSGGVTPHGELLMWGWGGSVGEATYLLENYEGSGGQLGHETDFDSWFPILIPPPSLPEAPEFKYCSVSCGLNHTAAIVEVLEL